MFIHILFSLWQYKQNIPNSWCRYFINDDETKVFVIVS